VCVCVIVVVGLGLLSGSYHVLLHIGASCFLKKKKKKKKKRESFKNRGKKELVMRAEVLIAETHDVIIARSNKEYLLRRNHHKFTRVIALSFDPRTTHLGFGGGVRFLRDGMFVIVFCLSDCTFSELFLFPR